MTFSTLVISCISKGEIIRLIYINSNDSKNNSNHNDNHNSSNNGQNSNSTNKDHKNNSITCIYV